jgi:hypothetical protein
MQPNVDNANDFPTSVEAIVVQVAVVFLMLTTIVSLLLRWICEIFVMIGNPCCRYYFEKKILSLFGSSPTFSYSSKFNFKLYRYKGASKVLFLDIQSYMWSYRR